MTASFTTLQQVPFAAGTLGQNDACDFGTSGDHRFQLYRTYSAWKNYDAQVRATGLAAAAKHFANSLLARTELSYILRQCPKHARIVELGCGSGDFLHQLARNGFTNLSGVDRAYSCPSSSPIDIHHADAFDFLQENTAPVDLLIMLDVLEHFTRAEAIDLLTLCRKRLMPNGRLLCRVPNAGSPYGLGSCFGDLTHELHLNNSSVRQLARTCGFNSPTFLKSQNRWRTIASAIVRPLDFSAALLYAAFAPIASFYQRGARVFHGDAPETPDAYLVFVLTPASPGDSCSE